MKLLSPMIKYTIFRGRFFKGLQNYMENINEGEQYLEALIVLCIKCTRMVKIKYNDFMDAVPIMHCQISSWIMNLMIYGERRAPVPLSSPAPIAPLVRIQDRQSLY